MKTEVFTDQIARLKIRFGAAHFDREFQKLVWTEVRDLPDSEMVKLTNHLIGELRPEWPPKLSDFRTQAEQLRKSMRQRETELAARDLSRPVDQKAKSDAGLQKILKEKNATSILDLIFKKQG